jgi:hypothetical protein
LDLVFGDGDGALLPVQFHQLRIGDYFGLDDGRNGRGRLLFVESLVGLHFVKTLVKLLFVETLVLLG